MNKQPTKKYDNKTVQESLSPDEIKKMLIEYILVDDIDKVPLGTHIRYFSEQNGKKMFRLGGNLTKIDIEYIVLSNGKVTWSVQKATSTFFKKMS